jgi:hypothetical protein
MRDSCLDCVIKHLGTAFTHFEEAVSSTSYAHHAGYGIGELQHAEEEARRINPAFAHKIAIVRRAITRDIRYWQAVPSDMLMREAFDLAGKLPPQDPSANKQFPAEYPSAKDIQEMLDKLDKKDTKGAKSAPKPATTLVDTDGETIYVTETKDNGNG